MGRTRRLCNSAAFAMWFCMMGMNGVVKAFSQFGPSQGLRRAATNRMMSATVSLSTGKGIIPRIKTADAIVPSDGPVLVKGWVRTVRKQKTLAFVEVNDGSNLGGIQCVASFDSIDEETKQGMF